MRNHNPAHTVEKTYIQVDINFFSKIVIRRLPMSIFFRDFKRKIYNSVEGLPSHIMR